MLRQQKMSYLLFHTSHSTSYTLIILQIILRNTSSIGFFNPRIQVPNKSLSFSKNFCLSYKTQLGIH